MDFIEKRECIADARRIVKELTDVMKKLGSEIHLDDIVKSLDTFDSECNKAEMAANAERIADMQSSVPELKNDIAAANRALKRNEKKKDYENIKRVSDFVDFVDAPDKYDAVRKLTLLNELYRSGLFGEQLLSHAFMERGHVFFEKDKTENAPEISESDDSEPETKKGTANQESAADVTKPLDEYEQEVAYDDSEVNVTEAKKKLDALLANLKSACVAEFLPEEWGEEINPREEKAFSASEFKKAMRRLPKDNWECARWLFSRLATFGSVAPEDIVVLTPLQGRMVARKTDEKAKEFVCEYCYGKGYLRRYKWNDKIVYSISHKGMRALESQEVRRFFSISSKVYNLPKYGYTPANIVSGYIGSYFIAYTIEKNITNITRDGKFESMVCGSSCALYVENLRFLMLSLVDATNINEFVKETFDKLYNADRDIKRVVFASSSLSQAEAIFNQLNDMDPDMFNFKVFLFAPGEGLVSKDDGRHVTMDEVIADDDELPASDETNDKQLDIPFEAEAKEEGANDSECKHNEKIEIASKEACGTSHIHRGETISGNDNVTEDADEADALKTKKSSSMSSQSADDGAINICNIHGNEHSHREGMNQAATTYDEVSSGDIKDVCREKTAIENGAIAENVPKSYVLSNDNGAEVVAPEGSETIVVSDDGSTEDSTSSEDAAASIDELASIVASGRIYAATTYAASLSSDPKWAGFSQKLSYAVNDPMASCRYTGENMMSIFSDVDAKRDDLESALFFAAMLRACFYNQRERDYGLQGIYDGNNLKSSDFVSANRSIGNVLYEIVEFRRAAGKGMDAYADYRHKDNIIIKNEMENIYRDATEYKNAYIGVRAHETASFPRYIETLKLIFSPNSDMSNCISLIAEKESDRGAIEVIASFVEQFFEEDDEMVESNISIGKIDEFINIYWELAQESLVHKKNNISLVSSYLAKLENKIKKAITIMLHWMVAAEGIATSTDDKYYSEYRKRKKNIMGYIKDAVGKMNTTGNTMNAACMRVVRDALDEIRAKLDGSWDEANHTFFYVPFLLTDDIILDDNYLPLHGNDYDGLPGMSVISRIRAHIKKAEESDMDDALTWKSRLDAILKSGGDDCGSARLIVSFISTRNPELTEYVKGLAIDETVSFCANAAHRKEQDFKSRLELWQSYGQISGITDEKERIRDIVARALSNADIDKNYGFFGKVLKSCELKIKTAARKRGRVLKHELDEYVEKLRSESGIDAATEARLENVRKMLNEQNYTVAEDMLNRIKRGELDSTREMFPKDYLSMFLNDYEVLYQRVIDFHRPLRQILSRSFTQNKEGRAAARIVDNWIINSRNTQSLDKLRTLLTYLGFDAENVTFVSTKNKVETFHVKIRKPMVYTHPISAFGSEAVEQGMRVAVLFGRYNADSIIEKIKGIGDTQHTILLLDDAVKLTERRRLARKIKEAALLHVYCVVDRVLISFLVSHYDEAHINSILMFLMMPFADCQPYVYDSAKPMPPEIFMGRRDELKRIESPEGINILYGGRQLGKSALLKMARNHIDRDEQGDRAVYVDVKDLDYSQAAERISEELIDTGVLKNGNFRHDDWSELARALRRRLNEQNDRIPYLLLLIDEGDRFIDSCEDVNYQPFDMLKNVQGVGQNRFKFVIAGLRNIIRFKQKSALSNNSVLTHLSSMTVTPFKANEARELLEIPLRYIGVYFEREKENLIYLICSSANYFPGLIQFYCAKLIESMEREDYAGFDESDTPGYHIREEQIQHVLADPAFTEQIREKFMITLRLEKDNYYYIIALLIAYLYHNKKSSEGYSASDIIDAGKEFGIKKIATLSEKKLTPFLEEMAELYVLRFANGRYLFSTYNFLELMGNADHVELELIEISEAEE